MTLAILDYLILKAGSRSPEQALPETPVGDWATALMRCGVYMHAPKAYKAASGARDRAGRNPADRGRREMQGTNAALNIAIGITIGAGIGLALGNVGLGIGLGVAIGIAMNMAAKGKGGG